MHTCILALPFVITHIHFLPTEKTIIFDKQENYKFLVLTEYVTGEKLLFSSFIPFILFFSFCPLTSFSSTPSSSYSLCFLFSLLPCTSISFPLDSGHENCSSSESWPSIPASFFKATMILWIFFLKPCNSLNSSNFLETPAFHFASVCCFVFLALDLQTASALAFACALSASKGLQAVLALAQGAHEIA